MRFWGFTSVALTIGIVAGAAGLIAYDIARLALGYISDID